MSTRGIGGKILLMSVAGVLFTTIVSILAMTIVTRSWLARRSMEQAGSEADNLADRMVEPLLVYDHIALKELIDRTLARRPELSYLFVCSPSGDVIASSFVGGAPRAILHANDCGKGGTGRTVLLDTGRGARVLDVARNILGGLAGNVRLGMRQSAIADLRKDAARLLLLVQGGSVVLAVLASAVLALILLRPIDQMVRAVHRVAQGDLSVRTGVTSRDQIGELARAFDTMVDRLRVAQATMQDLAAMAQGIVSSFPNALFVVDVEHRIVSANRAAREMTEREDSALVGQPLFALFVSGPERSVIAGFEELLSRQGPTLSYALSLLREGRKPLPVAFHAAPMATPYGFRGYVVEVRDMRQLHRAIEVLEQQRSILEETESEAWSVDGAPETDREAMPTTLVRSDRLVSLGQLAASVAHELNNPLFSIITCAKILVRDAEAGKLDGETQRLLKTVRTILAESSRCSSILREFLGYARVNRPGSGSVGVGSVLESLRTLIEAKATEQQVNIILTAGFPDEVHGDPHELQQVFLNIALNALQAMPSGGELRLEVIPEEATGHLRVRLSDTGGGIPANLLPRVMEPFFTTKEPGQGTGLGLSVARDVVKRHGGSIALESKVGEGTRVVVTLPLARSSREEQA